MSRTLAGWDLVQKALEKLSSTGARSEVLTSAIAKTDGLFMAVDFVALVDAPSKGSAEGPFFPEGELCEGKTRGCSQDRRRRRFRHTSAAS